MIAYSRNDTRTLIDTLQVLLLQANGAIDQHHAYERKGNLYGDVKIALTNVLAYQYGDHASDIYESLLSSGESIDAVLKDIRNADHASIEILHAHVSNESRDCDGRYSRSHIVKADDGQTHIDFLKDMMGLYLDFQLCGDDEPVTVKFTDDGFTYITYNEEGYSEMDITLCTANDADQHNTFRDHSAEAAGY